MPKTKWFWKPERHEGEAEESSIHACHPLGVLEGCGFDAWSLPLGSRLVGPAILKCNGCDS